MMATLITCATCSKPQGLAFGSGWALPTKGGGLGSAGGGMDWYCSEKCHPLAPFPDVPPGLTDIERLVEELYLRNPDALLVGFGEEEVEAYKVALVGITNDPPAADGVDDHWPRAPGTWVAVYDADKCIEVIAGLMARATPLRPKLPDDAFTEATEWFHFNVAGGWHGEGTPCFRYSQEDTG